MLIHWCCISDCIFACGAKRSKCNREYLKDRSLVHDTVGDLGAGPRPLHELVEGLHYSEMQTSELREQLSSWSLFSDFVGLIIDAAF